MREHNEEAIWFMIEIIFKIQRLLMSFSTVKIFKENSP